MEPTTRSWATAEPQREFPNAPTHGAGSLLIGLCSLLSPFVTAPLSGTVTDVFVTRDT